MHHFQNYISFKNYYTNSFTSFSRIVKYTCFAVTKDYTRMGHCVFGDIDM